ncbi:MAG: glycosyltransferase family 9 protein [Endomicrobia bacterium]|nr:glycosyltransferase family 9 protein [Endomicrobiia bacterium]
MNVLLKNYKQNCMFFETDRPCCFHKEDPTVLCGNCKHYKPIKYKILIIKLSAIGDVVRTTSILKPLKQKYKNSKIYWLTEDISVDVLKYNSYINKIIPLSKVFEVFAEFFHILINLDLDKTALYLSSFIKAKDKIGFYIDNNDNVVVSNDAAREWFDMSHNDNLKKANRKTYQQYMLEILGIRDLTVNNYPIIINLSKEEKNFAQKFIEQKVKNYSKNIKFVGINLGGGDKWNRKEYPIDKTIMLIKNLLESKNSKNLKVLLYGGERERKRNIQILEFFKREKIYSDKVLDMGCNNSLREFFALLDLCDVLVTSDTMALHVALALGKKTLSIFGPTSPYEIELYNLGEKIISPKECIVCYRRNCDKSPSCMDLVSPKIILNKILKLLRS